jgi:hypothetical protein
VPYVGKYHILACFKGVWREEIMLEDVRFFFCIIKQLLTVHSMQSAPMCLHKKNGYIQTKICTRIYTYIYYIYYMYIIYIHIYIICI